MESTGLPEMIQISHQSYELLTSSFPTYGCSYRGEVDIKVSHLRLGLRELSASPE